MVVIIDRFESNLAVCKKEDKSIINIHISKLSKEVKEGDVLIIKKDKITIGKSQTNKLKKEIDSLMGDLWE